MDKPAIKKFASWARNELLSRVSQKALQFGISPDGITAPTRILSSVEERQLKILIGQIEEKTYSQVIEEIAYTWFNRFCALRFMEVNGYLPSQTRVFTDGQGRFRPLVLSDAIDLELEGLDLEKVYTFKQKNQDEELYKYLILTLCKALEPILPGMFRRIDDAAILLFPDNLLHEESIAGQFAAAIPESDWLDGVQIIGWLYQYYNSEPKNKVFADLKKNIKITKENIPAATQLFTPDWIVRYMVENSLGRLWLEGHPNENLKKTWRYFLDEAPQEPEVLVQLEPIRKEYAALRPDQIRCIDPCSGSGHILAYMFDVLMQIYEAYGYTSRDAVASIVTNNLFGLDIDERAAQLSYFTVMMKARQYDRSFFRRGIQPNVYAIAESNNLPEHMIDYFAGDDPVLLVALQTIANELHDAKEYGSILTISPQDWPAIHARMEQILADPNYPERDNIQKYLFPLIHTAETLSQTYDIVCTNPPYMGGSGMDAKLSEFVKKNYPDSKSDLFAVFIEKCSAFAKQNGYFSMITQHAWMFLSSFEKLRNKLQQRDTVNMAHLGPRAFDEIGGEVVQTTTFVMRNSEIQGYKGTYCRLIEPTTQQGKEDMFLAGENRYSTQQENFVKIPGAPIAYWINPHWFNAYDQYPIMRDICVLKKGTSTGDNQRFIRHWQEVNVENICFTAHNPDDALKTRKKWFPINGGGERRKWYGNRFDVVNWEADGTEMKALATRLNHGGHWSRYIINPDRFFTESIGWSAVSSSCISVRYIGYGFAFSSAAMEAFECDLKYLMALINSVVAEDILKLLAPTLNFGVEQIGRIPYKKENASKIEEIADDCINISKTDWDSFETSWDFQKHPLI